MRVADGENTGSDNNIQSCYITVTTGMRDWREYQWN
jgi:hypothetical protein